MSRTSLFTAAFAPLVALVIRPSVIAAPITWDVDSAQSFVRLTIPDQSVTVEGITVTVRLRNVTDNSTWTDAEGRRAALDGTIATELNDGSSVEFLSAAHNLFALEQTNLRPNPAAFNPTATSSNNPYGQYDDNSTAPAALGAKVRLVNLAGPVDAGFMAMRDVLFDIASGVVPLGGGTTIAPNATNVGVVAANLDLDGLLSFGQQPFPDLLNYPLSQANVNNSLGGSITDEGGFQRKLTLNVNIPFDLAVNDISLSGTAQGVIVAYATIPEPSSALMLVCALTAIGAQLVRRRRGSRPQRRLAARAA